MRGRPRSEKTKFRRNTAEGREYRLVAEKALGKPLPKSAVVHHVDYDEHNNDPSNLVICQDQAYHFMLHNRTNALEACGNPNYRKCGVCGEYGDPTNMLEYRTASKAGVRYNHRSKNRKCLE